PFTVAQVPPVVVVDGVSAGPTRQSGSQAPPPRDTSSSSTPEATDVPTTSWEAGEGAAGSYGRVDGLHDRGTRGTSPVRADFGAGDGRRDGAADRGCAGDGAGDPVGYADRVGREVHTQRRSRRNSHPHRAADR